MKSGNERGYCRPSGSNIELQTGWDFDEDVSVSETAIDLNTATVITLTNEPRNAYYCRGFHNPNATAMTIKYTCFDQTAATLHTAYILAGGIYSAHVNVATIGGTGATVGTLKLYWKDRRVVDGSGPRKIA